MTRVRLRRSKALALEPKGCSMRPGAALIVMAHLVLAVAPRVCEATQEPGWVVAPAVMLDRTSGGDTQVGPGIIGEVTLRAGHVWSYWAGVSLARTDFSVGADDLHRNFGAAALGFRFLRSGTRPTVGLFLGIGALFWDDRSETDPAFRSSANAEEMLLPGAELRLPLRGAWGVSLSVRDQLTGWWYAIVDSEERDLGNRIIIAVGLYHN